MDSPAAGLRLESEVPELGRQLGAELLEPTRIYARDCLALARSCDVHAFAHVTGGGIAANLARVLPPHADAVLDRGTWSPPPVFGLLAARGRIADAEMEQVFNMGIGMAAVVGAPDADNALRLLRSYDVPAWAVGQIGEGTGAARLAGKHPGADRHPV